MDVHADTPDPLLTLLKKAFGYDSFRSGQRELIEALLAGRDAVGVLPTGAGKSLVYQLPALVGTGTTLVISPLIALMKDQVDALLTLGIPATFLNSSLSSEDRAARLEGLRRGAFRLAYVSPEGLGSSLGSALAQLPLKLIAVDEAHCISSWGHDFRPAYRSLEGLKRRFGHVPILALTATATPVVEQDIVEQLAMVAPLRLRRSFFRPNLRLHAYKKGGERDGVRHSILRLVSARRGQAGIVYCLARQSAERTADFLKEHGIAARAYHAGLDSAERSEIQDAFRCDDLEVVTATVAFGMGIDKPNVRYVLHRDMPRSMEAYYQEIGRAGRDGAPSECVLFYSWADVLNYDRFQSDAPAEVAERNHALVRTMYRFADGRGCRHRTLLDYLGETHAVCTASCDVCAKLDLLAETPAAARRGTSNAAANATPRRSTPVSLPTTGIDAPLVDSLKALRRTLSSAQKVPAYFIFSDATLLAIARARPRDAQELLAISGVGPRKLEQYGELFLRAVSARAVSAHNQGEQNPVEAAAIPTPIVECAW